MSRRSRAELEAAGIDAIRGWQTDQDIFDDATAEFSGINRTDARCIDILDREGPMTAGRLAMAARLTSGAITAVLDRLERDGLVRRVRDTTDRRRVMVETTPEVMRRAAPVFGPLAEDGMAQMNRYTDDELELIVEFLERSRAMLQRHTIRLHGLIAEQDRARATAD